VSLVFFADFFHVRGVREVVVTVGKLDTALQEVCGVAVGIVEAGGDPEAEDVGGVEVGVVEGVDVGADGKAEGVGEFFLGVDGGDFIEEGLDGSEAVGLDGGFVHEGVVEVGDAAIVGVGGGVGFGGLFDERGDALVGAIDEEIEGTEGGAIGGERGAVDPGAVGVVVEVVAGTDGHVDAGDGDAVFDGSGAGVFGMGEEREGEEEGEEEGLAEVHRCSGAYLRGRAAFV